MRRTQKQQDRLRIDCPTPFKHTYPNKPTNGQRNKEQQYALMKFLIELFLKTQPRNKQAIICTNSKQYREQSIHVYYSQANHEKYCEEKKKCKVCIIDFNVENSKIQPQAIFSSLNSYGLYDSINKSFWPIRKKLINLDIDQNQLKYLEKVLEKMPDLKSDRQFKLIDSILQISADLHSPFEDTIPMLKPQSPQPYSDNQIISNIAKRSVQKRKRNDKSVDRMSIQSEQVGEKRRLLDVVEKQIIPVISIADEEDTDSHTPCSKDQQNGIVRVNQVEERKIQIGSQILPNQTQTQSEEVCDHQNQQKVDKPDQNNKDQEQVVTQAQVQKIKGLRNDKFEYFLVEIPKTEKKVLNIQVNYQFGGVEILSVQDQ